MPRPQLANKPKDLQEINVRLTKISGYSRDVIFAMTVSQLRELAAFIIQDARKKKHDELAHAIYEAGQKFIESRKIELNNKLNSSVEFNTLENMLINAYLKHKDIHILLEDLSYYWKVIKRYAPTTIASTKPKDLRQAIEKIKYEYPEASLFLDEFYQVFYKTICKPYKDNDNKERMKELNKVKTIDEKIKMHGDYVLDWAVKTIKIALSLENSKILRGWYELSLALAITSGRRMEEIHGETVHISKGITRYYSLEGNQVFISQLAKSDENTSFKFLPIGISSEDWLNGFNKLPDSALKLTEDKVNKTICTNIAKSLRKKQVFKDLNFESYKSSRDFYVAYRIATEYQKGKTNYNNEADFVQSIIGHDSKMAGLYYQKFVIV
jgi:hypothetical protein